MNAAKEFKPQPAGLRIIRYLLAFGSFVFLFLAITRLLGDPPKVWEALSLGGAWISVMALLSERRYRSRLKQSRQP
ncbi:hypothetical protein J4573_17980 [Actinomadura barringtoniae]|uniref:Uncharacterized protein n=1 Tax=Actinomadura barringtoniae TaxID=1427535 RepID=A0A939PB86_9ACTN|nr:hypothetical protein [Actinomadura barringtoniae]MBO2448997.1 hypothetical protein [Actinomadura barringtoniae]